MKNFPFEEATPESLGIPSGAIRKLIEACDTLDQAHALILMRHGKVAAACEWAPYSMDLPHELFSLSKSFVSSAIGIARSENRLKLTDKLVDFFPEYVTAETAPETKRLTLRDLLRMASGKDRCGFAFVDFEHGDWMRELFAAPVAYEPGTRFVYDSSATFLLAAVIHKVTGENVVDYLQPRMFDPMGIEKPEWNCNPQGINIGGWGLWLSVKDIAKFSQMLVNHGRYNGKQIVPQDYLDEATSFQIDNSTNVAPDWKVGYGYQFWRCHQGGFRCDGASGQYAIIYQKNDLTVSFVSGLSDMQRFLTAFHEIILPVLSDNPLPENPEKQKALANYMKALAVPLPESFKTSAKPAENVAGIYKAVKNHWNIQQFELKYDDSCCELEVDGVRIRAGFDSFILSQAALAAQTPHTVASRACWVAPNQLVIYALCIQTTARFTYEIHFEGNHAAIKRTTPIFFHSDRTDILYHGFRKS